MKNKYWAGKKEIDRNFAFPLKDSNNFVANIWQTFLGYIFTGESGKLRAERIQILYLSIFQ